MNTRLRAESINKPRKCSISAWDAEDLFEGFSPLKRVKVIHQQNSKETQSTEAKLMEKPLDKAQVSVPDRPSPVNFVVRKHHKTLPKPDASKEQTIPEAPEEVISRPKLIASVLPSLSPVALHDEAPIENPEINDQSIMLPASPAPAVPATISTPLSTHKKEKRPTVANIKEILMHMNKPTSYLHGSARNVSFIDCNQDGEQRDFNASRYVRRSWKSRQRTDYRIFDHPQ